jgi:hypothetical protein
MTQLHAARYIFLFLLLLFAVLGVLFARKKV